MAAKNFFWQVQNNIIQMYICLQNKNDWNELIAVGEKS